MTPFDRTTDSPFAQALARLERAGYTHVAWNPDRSQVYGFAEKYETLLENWTGTNVPIVFGPLRYLWTHLNDAGTSSFLERVADYLPCVNHKGDWKTVKLANHDGDGIRLETECLMCGTRFALTYTAAELNGECKA